MIRIGIYIVLAIWFSGIFYHPDYVKGEGDLFFLIDPGFYCLPTVMVFSFFSVLIIVEILYKRKGG